MPSPGTFWGQFWELLASQLFLDGAGLCLPPGPGAPAGACVRLDHSDRLRSVLRGDISDVHITGNT